MPCILPCCREYALMREAELHRSMREQYAAATSAEMEAWRAIQAERAEAKVRANSDNGAATHLQP